MPISDEVIELAPVKKTKKTLIILIACMGALFALAIAFLVMYLVKPSVTEDKNHIKSISVNTTELFSDIVDGQEVLYASIGNEYTVYSSVTVDNNSSTNVNWECPRDLIDIKEQKNDGEAYIKFVPRDNANGKVVTIKARAAAKVEESQTITFTIVNQGAEDIQVKSYGVSGNLTTVSDDNYQKELSITVPYYTMTQSSNNKTIRVNFNQLGKYKAASDEYSKLTSIDAEIFGHKGYKTNDVAVTSSNDKVIEIVSVSDSYFGFDVKANSSQVVELRLSANVYNDTDCKVITKVIKVKVEPNTALGYIDSMYIFNKPVVDAAFIKSVLKGGDTTLIDTQEINKKVGSDETLKVYGKNDRGLSVSKDFAIVLPYNRTIGYSDIFKHIAINPANIQYSGNDIKENWYKDKIKITSSNPAALAVDPKDGITLRPNSIIGEDGGKDLCELTFTDVQTGSAGASVTVPVRIVAQNTALSMSVTDSNGTVVADSKGKDLSEPMEVAAATDGKYTVTMTYTYIVPTIVDSMQPLLENKCLNNNYKLLYNSPDDMEISLSGSPTEKLEPDKDKTVDVFKFDKISAGNWSATFSFTVTVKRDSNGAAVLHYVKMGADLAGASLENYDKSFDIAVAFVITKRATKAWIVNVDDPEESTTQEDLLDIVTENNKYAGNFVRESATKATISVQNRSSEELSIVSEENIKKFVRADEPHFNIARFAIPTSSGNAFSTQNKKLTFRGDKSGGSATITFVVTDVIGTEIASFTINVCVIDAVDSVYLAPTVGVKPALYGGSANVSINVAANDVLIKHKFDDTQNNFKYSDVNLYYGNDVLIGGDDKKSSDDLRTFYHDGTPLYSFNVKDGRLTALADIYAYSYKTGLDFSRVKLEFLLGEDDEWIGKHYGVQFNYKEWLVCEFTRIADDVALFKDSDFTIAIERGGKNNAFIDSVNQQEESWLYASSVINIGKDNDGMDILVYTELKSDPNAALALVQKSYFTIASSCTYLDGTPAVGVSGGYYSANYRAPKLDSDTDTTAKFTVTHASISEDLIVTITNAKREVKSVEFFVADPDDSSKRIAIPNNLLTFGGFINGEKYEKTIYVKVTYVNYSQRHTKFEKVTLTFPDYLTVNGSSKQYTIVASGDIDKVTTYEKDCVINLVAGTNAPAKGEIQAMFETKNGAKASCGVEVCSGLDKITAKYKNDNTDDSYTEVTVTAGADGKNALSKTFNLKDRSDIKELELGLEYTAINADGYDIPFDFKSGKFVVSCPTEVSGLSIVNNIKGNTSTLTIKIPDNPNIVKTLKNQLITVGFTDTNNGADENNVFTLEIYISVTMDIYNLAFVPDSSFSFTVTGESEGEQPAATISILYNNGVNGVAPTDEIIEEQNVVGIYVEDENGNYKSVTPSDIYVEKDGATYKLHVKNCIDRSVKYYVGLAYGNVMPNKDKHFLRVVINTLTSHIEFAKKDNISLKEVEGNLVADVTVADAAINKFHLAVDVVNDGSGDTEAGKTVTYELYSDPAYNNKLASGAAVTIAADGWITVNPNKISDTVYYKATYTDGYNGVTYTKKAVFKYSVAPSKVKINLTSAMFDATGKVITLYYDGTGNYTNINLSGLIVASNSFENVPPYAASDITTSVQLKTESDSAYVQLGGLTVTPIGLNNNAATDVVIVISAEYKGESVTEEYTVRIVPIQAVTLAGGNEISLVDNTDRVTVTPTIVNYAGLNHSYDLVNNTTGMFTISGTGDEKTVALAGSTAKKGESYKLTATLTYNMPADSAFTAYGTFTSTAQYSITVVGDYTPTFDLVKVVDGNEELIAVGSEYATDSAAEGTTYRLVIMGDDSKISAVAYSATFTNSVISSIGAFTNKKAAITLNSNASGAFSITVSAKVDGTIYTCTQNYNFTYGIKAEGTLYVSANGVDYTKLTADEQNIDYTTTPYTFKYVVSGIPSTATVNIVVNGDVEKGTLQTDSDNNQFIIITAKKPTTLRVGGSVKVGSRTIYLEDKTVELTAALPDFELSCGDNTSVMPAKTLEFKVTKDANFINDYTIVYSVTPSYATIVKNSENRGILTANANVVTDQTVIVRATVTVSKGVYADTYILEKAITVNGVALPSVKWNDVAKNSIGIGTHTYSSSDAYSFEKNGFVDYTAAYKVSVSNTTLASADYSITDEGVLTINNTANAQAGGSITLRVTAKITCDTHKDEEVYDEITVLVIPTMSKTKNGFTLGNAKNTYDLNGDKYKDVFAPNGLAKSAYGIVALSVDDTTNFGVDGANLIVKSNIESATSVEVTATVLITSGTYKGATVTGTKTVTIAVPQAGAANTFVWSSTNVAYGNFGLTKANTIGNNTDNGSAVTSIIVTDIPAYVSVSNNGEGNPVISVDKTAATYLTGEAPQVSFNVAYTVTLENGNVYYSKAAHTVNAVMIAVSAAVGSDTVSSVSVNANESVIVKLNATNGFTVAVNSVTKVNDLDFTYGGDSVQINASSVSTNKDVNVAIYYTVGGKQDVFTLPVTIVAPYSGAAYTANNTGDKLYAKGDNGAVTSKWSRADRSYFQYGYSVTVSAPDRLNKYFETLSINSINATSLTNNSVTIYFNDQDNRGNYKHDERTESFNLYMKFNTDAELAWSTIEVKFVVYSSAVGNNYTTVTVQYRVRVIDKIAVSLDTNAGNDHVECNPVVYASYQGTYNLPNLTRNGYTFEGWYDYAVAVDDESADDYRGKTVTATTAQTLYAHWTAKTYTLKYDGYSNTKIVTYGKPYGELYAPTQEGSKFINWTNDDGNVITADTLVLPVGDVTEITLTPNWTTLYYTVTLNANGGTIGSSATTLETQVAYNGSYNLHTVIVPTYAGHTFDGWYTETTGGSKVTTAQTITETTTLYAHWTEHVQYIVSFDLNYMDATGAPASKTYEVGETYGTLPEVSREDYKFDGWYTSDNVKVTSEQTVTATITLYAHWTQQFTVTLDAGENGSIGGSRYYVTTVSKDDSYSMHLIITPTCEGYKFDGWYTSDNANVTSEQTVTAAITLYAHWTQQFTVTLDAGEGVIGSSATYATVVDSGASYSMHLTITPVREGYTFAYWKDSTGARVSTAFNVTAVTTLTAEWNIITYTVTFDANGGVLEGQTTQTVDYNQAYTLPTDEPTRENYTFEGWYTQAEGGEEVTAGSTLSSDITLFAQWTEKTPEESEITE